MHYLAGMSVGLEARLVPSARIHTFEAGNLMS